MILFKTNTTFSYGCKFENYVERKKLNEYVLKYLVNEYFHTQK